MSARYCKLFERLADRREGAFVPFVTLGDPDRQTSLQIVQALIDGGADALELGIPFSDPLADGPVIEAANARALRAGVTLRDCLAMVREIRTRNPHVPIGLLLYANLVFVDGIRSFYESVAAAGADSVLVADVPYQEVDDFIAAAKEFRVAPVLILPPGADANTTQAVATKSEGYLYLMSRAGVTGTDTAASMPLRSVIENLKGFDSAPPLLGFGIFNPEQVRAALASGAAGVIVGSAIVRLIQDAVALPELTLQLRTFVRQMKEATVLEKC